MQKRDEQRAPSQRPACDLSHRGHHRLLVGEEPHLTTRKGTIIYRK